VRKNINKLINNFWNKIVDTPRVEGKQKLIKFSLPPEKCKVCKVANAKWFNSLLKEYSCDECIPRGCSCRLKRKHNFFGLQIEDYEYILDKQGKELPCEDWKKI
jgi:hypothetical protein